MGALTRRSFLGAAAGAAAAAAWPGHARAAGSAELALFDLTVDGDAELGRRFTLLVPRRLAPGERVPLVVLLHGLGETG
ncbi:MAG TPA: hypothetical protein VHB21_07120, partial [Minicystis sp.]|nr:hypothetical protein [Minicystis sp.]